ncbi:hypothetical protein [Lentzea sp. HUAS12]|uniref:hypothetical protein n=1 Tax=Lentzea sp. HUAS12 TaxID=2951806 RepID=UPI0020A100D8|nr:hypothetical protein [Lentzea sp. HUAS12]USX56314.1 hypothetical protein ND450_20090 [Lentzea sp. HUAS12]
MDGTLGRIRYRIISAFGGHQHVAGPAEIMTDFRSPNDRATAADGDVSAASSPGSHLELHPPVTLSPVYRICPHPSILKQ